MTGFNRVILAGNLTRDPELRYTPSGTAIAKFGLAVNRTWKDQNGEKKEECTFVDVDAFGKQAELIGQYLKKGNPLLVEGRLKLDQWDDKKTNEKRSRLGVVMESMTFLGSNERGNSPAPSARPPTADVPLTGNTPPEDDEPPF
jgi:single-strand DNA-binding protein